jgi:hypothetical protein
MTDPAITTYSLADAIILAQNAADSWDAWANQKATNDALHNDASHVAQTFRNLAGLWQRMIDHAGLLKGDLPRTSLYQVKL